MKKTPLEQEIDLNDLDYDGWKDSIRGVWYKIDGISKNMEQKIGKEHMGKY